MEIEKSVNKALNKVDLNSRNIIKVSGSRGGSSSRSNFVFHKCGNKGHLCKYCWSKGNCYSVNPSQNTINNLL